MRVFKWLFWLSVWAVVGTFLHYSLPSKDVVRVVGTDIRRVDVGDRPLFWSRADSGQATLANRDVRFIRAVDADGNPREYRNEDTAFGWPPYFKFDSDTLQTTAADAEQRQTDWFVLRHYGIRSNLLSIFPNALSMKPAPDGPETFAISYTRWIVIGLMVLLFWAIFARWSRFKEDRITPVLDDADAAWDARVAGWRRRRDRRRAERIARGR